MVLKVDEKQIPQSLKELEQNLDGAGEAVLDFSAVRRIDANAVRAFEDLARKADEKRVKIVLRGVNVDVYKLLKLVKLSPRFVFAA